jgi:lysyl-tRNA synthetase class I
MAKFASMKLKGENTSAWVEEFKTRRPLGATAVTVRKPKAPKTPEVNRPRTPPAPTTAVTTAEAIRRHSRAVEEREARNTTVKAKKEHSAKSRAYFNGLKSAREYLSTIGRPTGPNMSKFASMKLKGENTTAWEENFKTRRPLGAEPAKKTRKTAKKPLSAVKEEAENSNEE